jgi:hypothetical protein
LGSWDRVRGPHYFSPMSRRFRPSLWGQGSGMLTPRRRMKFLTAVSKPACPPVRAPRPTAWAIPWGRPHDGVSSRCRGCRSPRTRAHQDGRLTKRPRRWPNPESRILPFAFPVPASPLFPPLRLRMRPSSQPFPPLVNLRNLRNLRMSLRRAGPRPQGLSYTIRTRPKRRCP